MHPDGAKRAVIAGLGLAMVSRLTVEDDVRRKHLAIVAIKAELPSRPIVVVTIRRSITALHAARCCEPSRQLFRWNEIRLRSDRDELFGQLRTSSSAARCS